MTIVYELLEGKYEPHSHSLHATRRGAWERMRQLHYAASVDSREVDRYAKRANAPYWSDYSWFDQRRKYFVVERQVIP